LAISVAFGGFAAATPTDGADAAVTKKLKKNTFFA
jgi:hypothetical protein